MHIYAFTYVYILIFSSWTLSDLQIDGVRSLSLSLFCEALVLAISTEMISNVNIWHWKKTQHAHTHTNWNIPQSNFKPYNPGLSSN